MTNRVRAPRVSVGMPAYNSEAWLEQSVRSIIEQSFEDLELIISDNASEDGTEQLCRKLAARDPRIRYLRKPRNIGVANNYNAVLLEARGGYFKWASSNDLCDPGLIAQCVAVLDADPNCVLCHSRTRLILGESGGMEDYQEDLNLRQKRPVERFTAFLDRLQLNNVMNGVMRTAAIRRTGLYRNFLAGDVIMMGELALLGEFVQLPDFLFYRRMDERTATRLMPGDIVRRYYDPSGESKMPFITWRTNLAFVTAPWRLNLRIRDAVPASLHALRRAVWARRELMLELRQVILGARSGQRNVGGP